MRLCYILFGSFFLNACSQTKPDKNFEKRIPIDAFGNFSLPYRYVSAQTKYAQLPEIENGVDSVCIRFWCTTPSNADQQIFEFLKKRGNPWYCKYYYLVLDTLNIKLNYSLAYPDKVPDSGQNYYTLDTSKIMYKIAKRISLKEPSDGWDKFIQRILQTRILNAPDWTNIYNYEENPQSNSILVEIATSEYYRVFSYPFLSQKSELNGTQKILSVIKLIENEFKIPIL